MNNRRNERVGYRGYIFSRPILGERVPQHVQNLVVRDYARRNSLMFKLSAVEYAMPECSMMFESVLAELPTLNGIILYSLFMLPKAADRRRNIYAQVLASGASLHAALEDTSIHSETDALQIEDILRVRQLLPLCPKTVPTREIM